jgi:signal transduction histidine kinase
VTLGAFESRGGLFVAGISDVALFEVDRDGLVRALSPAGHALTGLNVGDAFVGAFATMPTLVAALATPLHVCKQSGQQLRLEHMRVAQGWVVALHRDLSQGVQRALFEWNVSAGLFNWTTGFEETFGMKPNEFLERLHPDDAPYVKLRLKPNASASDGLWTVHVRLHLATGWQPVQLTATTRPRAESTVVGVVEPLVERPERRPLTGAERLTSVGTVAGGLAHELNNPLAWVTSNVNFALEELQRLNSNAHLSECVAALRDARAGADRLGAIVRDLRFFSRSDDAKIGPVDVHRCIESALTMASHELRPNIRVVRALSPVPPVAGNEGRLSQLALHLIVNAAQALDGGPGTVTIETSIDPTGAVRLAISDDGPPITPDQLPHLFHPNFDRLGTGRALGVGRSLAQALVSELGGTLSVERGQGHTTFRARLPVAVRTSTPTPVPLRARVAVVDDEPTVIAMLQRALGSEFEVHAFTTGEAALAALGALAPDVVVCDVGLPGISGPTLYDTLHSTAPTLAARFVMVTGEAQNENLDAWVKVRGVPLLQKPFGLERLKQIVRDRLTKP